MIESTSDRHRLISCRLASNLNQCFGDSVLRLVASADHSGPVGCLFSALWLTTTSPICSLCRICNGGASPRGLGFWGHKPPNGQRRHRTNNSIARAHTHLRGKERSECKRAWRVFFEGLVRLRRRVVARGQAGGNLTLTWMKAIVTIENPSMRRMNALTQAFARRMRRSGIFQCEGHAAL